MGKDNGERWSAVKGGVYLRAQDSARKAGLAERWVRLDILLVLGKTLWPIPDVIGLGRLASLVGRVPSVELRNYFFFKEKIFFFKKKCPNIRLV